MTTAHHDTDHWYVRSFGPLYGLLYRHRDDAAARQEIGQLADLLGLHSGDRVLDVGCGGGRHLGAMLELGFDAYGVDLSESLLNQAYRRREMRHRLIRADMRAMPLAQAFDATVSLFTSFGYFPSESQDRDALRQMIGTLGRGGRLALDVMNPPHVRRELEPSDCERVDDLIIENQRRIAHRRVVKETTVTELSGEVHRFTESVRLYEAADLSSMFADAGLADIRTYGSLDGQLLTPESSRLIIVGARR